MISQKLVSGLLLFSITTAPVFATGTVPVLANEEKEEEHEQEDESYITENPWATGAKIIAITVIGVAGLADLLSKFHFGGFRNYFRKPVQPPLTKVVPAGTVSQVIQVVQDNLPPDLGMQNGPVDFMPDPGPQFSVVDTVTGALIASMVKVKEPKPGQKQKQKSEPKTVVIVKKMPPNIPSFLGEKKTTYVQAKMTKGHKREMSSEGVPTGRWVPLVEYEQPRLEEVSRTHIRNLSDAVCWQVLMEGSTLSELHPNALVDIFFYALENYFSFTEEEKLIVAKFVNKFVGKPRTGSDAVMYGQLSDQHFVLFVMLLNKERSLGQLWAAMTQGITSGLSASHLDFIVHQAGLIWWAMSDAQLELCLRIPGFWSMLDHGMLAGRKAISGRHLRMMMDYLSTSLRMGRDVEETKGRVIHLNKLLFAMFDRYEVSPEELDVLFKKLLDILKADITSFGDSVPKFVQSLRTKFLKDEEKLDQINTAFEGAKKEKQERGNALVRMEEERRKQAAL